MASIHLPVQTPTQQELKELRDRLGRLTASSMQEMVQKTEEAMRDRKLNEGIWYPHDYIRASGDRQSKRLNLLKENGHLEHGWAPIKFWDPVYDLVGKQMVRRNWGFIAKKGVCIFEAIKAAKAGLSILDCGAVCQLARYDALIQVLGVERAARIFKDVRINIDYAVDDERQPMRYFVRFTSEAIAQYPGSVDRRMVKVGQLVLFNGVPIYASKHPTGMGSNHHVICLDDTPGKQLYVGHGLPSQGASEEEIAQIMVREYNQDPDHFSRAPSENQQKIDRILRERCSAAFRDSKMPEDQPLKKVFGFDYGSQQDFCTELIYDLLQLPLSEVSLDYVISHPKSTKKIPSFC